MLKIKGKINLILLVFNIFCLLYYSIQLLAFTDEFVSSNIGFFNHAVAGLSEIIGIIFFCLAIGLGIIGFVNHCFFDANNHFFEFLALCYY